MENNKENTWKRATLHVMCERSNDSSVMFLIDGIECKDFYNERKKDFYNYLRYPIDDEEINQIIEYTNSTYGYGYGSKKEIAEHIRYVIEKLNGKDLSYKTITFDDIMDDLDNLENKVNSSRWGTSHLRIDFFIPMLLPKKVSEPEEPLEPEEKKKYTCSLEIAPSAALDSFVSNKQEFLEMYQVGSDEFAYDYQEQITKAAKSIFGEDRIETAIYDFGGDSKDFKILISLWTKNENENDRHFYFKNRSDNELPKGITVQTCLKMQEYNYDLVEGMYESFISSKDDSDDDD